MVALNVFLLLVTETSNCASVSCCTTPTNPVITCSDVLPFILSIWQACSYPEPLKEPFLWLGMFWNLVDMKSTCCDNLCNGRYFLGLDLSVCLPTEERE